jgi:hypothetical protein
MRTILVVANFEHIGVRRATEDQFVKHNGAGLTFLPAYRVFFPGQTFSASEVSAALERNRIDATLVLDPQESGTTSQCIPPSYSTSCVAWSPQGGCTQSRTAPNSSGVTISKPWVSTSVSLFESRTGKSVWVASGFTGGNAFATTGTLLESIVGRIAAGLESDRVTERTGCLLANRDSVADAMQARITLHDSATVFRRWQNEASNPMQYSDSPTPRGIARVDSINVERARLGRYASERLSASPSPEEVAVLDASLYSLRLCESP